MNYRTECRHCGKPLSGMVNEGKPEVEGMGDILELIDSVYKLREKKKEYLVGVFMDARRRIIKHEVISIGTLTASLAHPREIFAPAIGNAAAGFVLVHNHPSGDPTPSNEDIRLTERLKKAGDLMGIELLDHLVVAENGCYSFNASGQL